MHGMCAVRGKELRSSEEACRHFSIPGSELPTHTMIDLFLFCSLPGHGWKGIDFQPQKAWLRSVEAEWPSWRMGLLVSSHKRAVQKVVGKCAERSLYDLLPQGTRRGHVKGNERMAVLEEGGGGSADYYVLQLVGLSLLYTKLQPSKNA